MKRENNTDRSGNSWSGGNIDAVWVKGQVNPNLSPQAWRWDICGSLMKFSEFGKRSSKYGWEIDHIMPVAHRGSDQISNLQPLHWENNAAKGDQVNWRCCS